MSYLSGANTGGGSGGFTNPMPNGTFLETFDKDDNQISLIGYLSEVIAIGDLTYGNSTFLASIDEANAVSGFFNVATDGVGLELVNDNTGSLQNVTYQARSSGVFEWKNASPEISLGNGVTHDIISQSDLVANNDVIYGKRIYANNDSLSETLYAREQVEITDVTTATESASITNEIIINGVLTPYQTVDENGATNHLLTRQAAEIVTGGVAYMAFETGYNTNVYGWQFGAGTTVPGAVTGWNGGAIFTDADAVGVNRTWLNIGTSSSASFRRVAYWDNAAAYTVGAYTPTRTLDPATATLTDALNLLATLLNDINIT